MANLTARDGRNEVNGKRVELRPVEGEFELLCEGKRIMVGSDARVLSNWALNNGATEVQWGFDLRIAEPKGAK